jgi:FdhD protein
MSGDDHLPVTGAVLAGGRSKRMGFDKTLASVDGQTLVSRVADRLRTVCAEILVVTNHPQDLAEADLPAGTRILTDELPYAGPLGALATAMGEASHPWVLVAAADMPWIEPQVVRVLWEHSSGAAAVVPRTDGGLEPLLALYSTAAEAQARSLLDEGERRPAALLDRVATAEVDTDELRSVDPELASFVNVNTPEELASAKRGDTPAPPREIVVRTPGDDPSRRSGTPVERQVTFLVNGTEIATVQATPDHLDELAVGFLVSEGVVPDVDAITSIETDVRRGLIMLSSAEEAGAGRALRTRYFTSGCGKGMTFASPDDAEALRPLESSTTLEATALATLMAEMDRAASMHRETGGMHACALAADCAIQIVREDIGRHNALDKVCGRAWLDGRSPEDGVLLTTGRITYEMVIKAAKCATPIVASRKAVSDLAVEIADALGITLVGYVRGGHMTVFTHPRRILSSQGGDRS